MTIDEMTAAATHAAKPTITLSAEDYERLAVLAHAASKRMPGLAEQLADEVGRAHVLAKGQRQQNVVCMNGGVESVTTEPARSKA